MSERSTVSVVIPTLNAEKYLDECLSSIRGQDYPQDRVEIVIADGGSTDRTLEIAAGYDVRVVANPLRTGESGKAVGIAGSAGRAGPDGRLATTCSSAPTGSNGWSLRSTTRR